MPELPEVETTRRGLLGVVGQRIDQVVIRDHRLRWPIPLSLPEILKDQHWLELDRRAKYILARCERGTLLLHLGMSGRLCLLAGDEPAQKHDHIDIVFESGQRVRLRDPRRFGAVLWLEGDPLQHSLLASLGPEPLEDAFDGAYLYRETRTRSAPIKTVIMDSHLVVGVGNIYASESLFRAGINPKIPANKLSKPRCERLVAEIKATLTDALAAGGSSLRDFFGADGNPGYFQQTYFVYGRTDEPCRVCGGAVRIIKQGQRSTFYCPKCQR
ncbi:formamidopyrimidine-DNA glycosylase [Novimethylophilus kurashikiensis]|uniref:Formamidopyrimidine-DNA glycosylase n=1 Tax=Novimethylophilus kurashikiensis TaxID=1825523 RepID=A0A2R5FCI9_9PROT|nr:bifunctional DNA-formamidopyrimidine glycosylase/DNA-(apurinic or apyrimidinic site) lyase [Novimethylophilus kurashikiensis]GBG15569.1 formamidopyrimidine-DNA glycosylase [Novimethylophilus kurashikiensis]